MDDKLLADNEMDRSSHLHDRMPGGAFLITASKVFLAYYGVIPLKKVGTITFPNVKKEFSL